MRFSCLFSICTFFISCLAFQSTFQSTFHDTSDIVSLQQTIALYPLAIDSKNFSALAAVFTSDVTANYSTGIGVLQGLHAVQTTLEASLAPVTSQHSLTTFSVQELQADKGTASTVQYFIANQFGVGIYEGQVLYAYGQYVDQWVVDKGTWKIAKRQLNYMGPLIGNLSILGTT